MIKSNMLKSAMMIKEISANDMVNALDINPSTYFRKVNGTQEFKASEMQTIAELLELTPFEIVDIFLSEK